MSARLRLTTPAAAPLPVFEARDLLLEHAGAGLYHWTRGEWARPGNTVGGALLSVTVGSGHVLGQALATGLPTYSWPSNATAGTQTGRAMRYHVPLAQRRTLLPHADRPRLRYIAEALVWLDAAVPGVDVEVGVKSSINGMGPGKFSTTWGAVLVAQDGGAWRPYYRLARSGALTAGAASDVLATSRAVIRAEYDEGDGADLAPELRLLLNGVTYLTLTGEANLPALDSATDGFAFSASIAGGAGSTVSVADARYRVELLP